MINLIKKLIEWIMRILYHKRRIVPYEGCMEYGYLYNWYAATDSRNIANTGWHVPSRAETNILQTYLSTNVGGKLKETGTAYWNSPNTGATNEVAFNGRGAGYRGYNGIFNSINKTLNIILTDQEQRSLGYNFDYFGYGSITLTDDVKLFGRSIRLLKDDSTLANYVGNDGKTYLTVKIGDQVWIAENLAETEYRDHSKIPIIENAVDWIAQTNGAMCAYNNDYTLVGCGETAPEVIES